VKLKEAAMRPQHWLYTIPLRVRSLFKRRLADVELDEELQFHLDQKTQEYISTGYSAEDARYAALREFRGVEQSREACRDQRKINWLQDVAQDIRYGWRMLRKTPGFTAVAILTLALGIGANTAIFSLIDAVMLRSLPVQNPEQLVVLARNGRDPSLPDMSFSNPVWQQVRERQDIFLGALASSGMDFDLAQGGEAHSVKGMYVSGDFFRTLGVVPVAGRLLNSSDDMRGCAGAVVLSYGFWQEHYGGAQSAVGSTIRLDRHSFPIVGVAPGGFFGVTVGQHFDVAVPICAEAAIPWPGEPNGQEMLDRPSAQWLRVMARLKPGVTIAQANARLQVLGQEIFQATVSNDWRAEEQKDFLARKLVAIPGSTGLSDLDEYNQPLRVLMILVGLVLLIACANIASLMLARATARRKEIAVRLAMGASRARLVRQLLTESILMSSLGALAGIFLARWGCAIMVRLISTSEYHVFLQFGLDDRIVAFTVGISLLTGILFGLLPALKSTRVSLTSAMKGTQSEEISTRSQFSSARWIVASQVALSLVIVIVAGLFVRSFRNLVNLDIGFNRTGVLLINTNLPLPHDSPAQRAAVSRQILDGLNSIPGVISASESYISPVSGRMWGLEYKLLKGGGPTGDDADAYMNFVSPGYFGTLRSPILAGRNFDDHDVAGAPLVIMINESMARRFFPNSQPVGQFLLTRDVLTNYTGPRRDAPPLQVIGVVKDTKYQTIRETNQSIAYFSVAQAETLDDPRIFEIRTAGDSASLKGAAEKVVIETNKTASLEFQTLETQVDDSLRQDHLLATLSGFFGALALLLAMIGLYGVLAYTVTQRRKEFGIRIALGAQKISIVRLIMRDVAILLAIGISGGMAISYWATSLIEKMLFGLKGRNTGTIIISAAALISVALVAAYLPARRATQTDPMLALRDE
jgi:putative ABC transport system permease protein